MEKGHKNRTHAILSASGSSRWINCTPSALIESKEPNVQSVYADEGTLAHELAELNLKRERNFISESSYKSEIEKIKSNSLYSDDMIIEIEKYTSYVLNNHISNNQSRVLMTEVKVDFSPYVPEGFGTLDSIIIGEEEIEVIDLKYGKGVTVSPVENSQLKLYALGALNTFDLVYDISKINQIKLTIVQPRLNNIESYSILKDDLLNWGEEISSIAKLAINGEGEYKSGDWCRWCKIKHKCREYGEENNRLAAIEFNNPLLSDDEILLLYSKIDQVTTWINAVKEYVLNEALKGKKWEGYKLVEGRTNRTWKDENLVALKLTEIGWDHKDIYKESIRGITDVEKKLGKEFKNIFSGLVVKPQGSPTLVPESDKRIALGNEQAIIDFS